ncbi:MAG TPA: DUF1761 domain-containing protein [Stackebrandtia sp.]|jgi:hypothetical protein|uniref:DUF1761 domain-containing protein n=1 Tax=Stackebrandtia sp. TaxID=2023065 RepID=UPI002D5F17CE|nr:DUF1761 domain-containing protein [Stackebrandtia sp.]HZE39839.1 DUF1761 domain-containing protein [Stackebrandtia sp.]
MDINYPAAGLAFVVGTAIAMAWYGKIFLAAWQTLTGIPPEDSKKASKRNMAQLLIANAITALGLAAAIPTAAAALNNDSVWLALLVGGTAWLAFSATTLLQHNAFELKPPKLTAINGAYQLALFLGMALVIGLL